jgi:hypothetical protein
MNTNLLRFVAMLLGALAMGMHLAHALELAPKLQWDADVYRAVQGTLYVWFGRIGPVLEIGALIAVGALAFRLRGRRPAFGLSATSFVMLLLSLVTWALVVLPANAQLAAWAASQPISGDWMQWRAQWQYGQAGIFGLHLVGFSALLRSVLVETDPR